MRVKLQGKQEGSGTPGALECVMKRGWACVGGSIVGRWYSFLAQIWAALQVKPIVVQPFDIVASCELQPEYML